MIKAVVFDMDGVMFDTERLIMKAWAYTGEKLGYGDMSQVVYKTLGLPAPSAKRVFLNIYGEDFKYDEFVAEYRKFVYEYYEEFGVPIKDGLFELLTYLKDNGYKIAVATSTSKKVALHHFDLAKVTPFLDEMVCGDMIERGKPSPDIYLKASELLGLMPNECIALEDSPNGLRAANSAGLKTIMVPDLIQPDEELSKLFHKKVNNLFEVIDILIKEKDSIEVS